MRFALDYDGTFDRAHKLWGMFVAAAQKDGHEVLIVTMRRPSEPLPSEVLELCEVVYTSRRAKVPFMDDRGITIDVWIDDSPHWLLTDSQ